MKNGILLINKPKNMTSRDVVNIICKKLKTKKVGHTGTLDPIATGLLIVCVNKATGLIDLITSNDKEYVARVKLGIVTDTLDITGNILKEDYNYVISKERIFEVLKSFIGTYMQEVPIYSAVKVNGRKLYEYARKGDSVILPKKEVTIKSISLLDYTKDSFSFKVTVSKGTYIRALIRDVGSKLNVLMTMEELTRTKIDNINLDNAINVNEVTENDLISIEKFLQYKKIDLDDIMYKKVSNGAKITYNGKEEYVLLFYLERLVAIYKKTEKNEMSLYKLF